MYSYNLEIVFTIEDVRDVMSSFACQSCHLIPSRPRPALTFRCVK